MTKLYNMIAWIIVAAGTAGGVPQIVCEAPEYDFGRRPDSETVVHEYQIKNAGDTALTIKRVKASCGCTAAQSDKETLAPGETSVVEAKFKLAGRHGKQRKTITVESDDPAKPRLQLILTGEITTEVALNPRYLNFGQVHKSVATTQSVALVSLKPEVRITGVTSDKAAFAATINPDGRGLTVRTVPPLAKGSIRARMTVTTDHPDGLTTYVNMGGVAVGDLSVVPLNVILRKAPAPARRVTLLVRPFKPMAFKIVKVDVPQEDVTTTIHPQTNGSVSIRIDGLRPTPDLNNNVIVIHTDVPAMPELRVTTKVIP